jgi:DNA-binding FrmR family transcriptional regulator
VEVRGDETRIEEAVRRLRGQLRVVERLMEETE